MMSSFKENKDLKKLNVRVDEIIRLCSVILLMMLFYVSILLIGNNLSSENMM